MPDDTAPPVESFSLRTSDGLVLEAEATVPADATVAAVLAHPHPVQGGTMRSLVTSELFRTLPERGVAVVRFNFRGVEGSEGTHGHGIDEQHDLVAGLDALTERAPGLPLVIAGWSFGADVALTVVDPRLAGWFLIAPPLRVVPIESMLAAPRPAAEAHGGARARPVPPTGIGPRGHRGLDQHHHRRGGGRRPLLRRPHRQGRRPVLRLRRRAHVVDLTPGERGSLPRCVVVRGAGRTGRRDGRGHPDQVAAAVWVGVACGIFVCVPTGSVPQALVAGPLFGAAAWAFARIGIRDRLRSLPPPPPVLPPPPPRVEA